VSRTATTPGTGHLAIAGGRPARSRPFPRWPDPGPDERAAIDRVLNSGDLWRVSGTETAELEGEFAAHHGAAAALAVGSGTDALQVALSVVGVGADDEVLVPAFTFAAVAAAVLLENAVPVIVDVDPDTHCLDPVAVEARLSPRTRAIVAVHSAGHPADLDALCDIARRHGIALVEDAAHAHGARWRDRPVGSWGAAGIFSFQQYKLMTAGEGGMIVSRDPNLISEAYLRTNWGRPRDDRTYAHGVLGSSSRLSELQAAVLRPALSRLDSQTARREHSAALLDSLLDDLTGVRIQGRHPAATTHPHYMYMLEFDRGVLHRAPRAAIARALQAEGVPCAVAYPPLHRTAFLAEPRLPCRDPELVDRVRESVASTSCPVAERLGETALWLHHRLLLADEAAMHDIAAAVVKVLGRLDQVIQVQDEEGSRPC
jgi:3-amino-5-hydroxybenzoate synthase